MASSEQGDVPEEVQEVIDAAEDGTLGKMTAPKLKAFCKYKGATVGGSKQDLLARAARLLGKEPPPPPEPKRKAEGAGGGAAKKAKPQPVEGPKYTVDMRKGALSGPSLKVLSWNVAGLRALLKKAPEALPQLCKEEQPDIICIQEHKLQEKHVEEIQGEVLGALGEGWQAHFVCSTDKAGYAGVAMFVAPPAADSAVPAAPTFTSGIGMAEHDNEGRVQTAELPECFVVNAYVPNAGAADPDNAKMPKRLDYRVGSWDPAFSAYIKSLEGRGKPVVLVGDLNCAREPIDIHNPAGNLKSAGFTPEERESFAKLFVDDLQLSDTFRAMHPGVIGYTYYSFRMNMRDKGKGWRLDYALVSRDLASKVHDAFIMTEMPKWSDHLPLGVTLKRPL
ncbi:unnamed protein product [Pedinophyceae sp. YPF-701]|nr:unnamed protein product [Pedinophyceae sp. YPF-701]